MKKYLLPILAFFILIMIILNPTNADFKNYLAGSGIDIRQRVDDNRLKGGRIGYYLIFSKFEFRTNGNEDDSEIYTYYGFMKNFFLVNKSAVSS